MTNDKPPVAPVEGHYALLRNGEISLNHIPYFRKNSPCAWECSTSGAKWLADGKSYNGRHLDIIATISPEAMNEAVKLSAEKSVYGEIVFGLRSRLEALIPLADAACDYADQHCRAFPIATAPRGQAIHIWDTVMNGWDLNILGEHSKMDPDWTHWAPLPPPPSNPPLPTVFTDLGAALEKIKGAG